MASPRNYHGFGSAAVGTNLTIVTMISAATIRPRLYDITAGCAATPADQATKFTLLRCTAAGTVGSSFTPIALDPADPAALGSCGSGVFGVEPTYTANSNLLTFDVNQRATFRFVCAPGSEFVAPATGANGIGLRSLTATGTATHEGSFLWAE